MPPRKKDYPGYRKFVSGKMNPARWAWTRNYLFEAALSITHPGEVIEDGNKSHPEEGDNVILTIQGRTRSRVYMYLTSLNAEELTQLEQIFMLGIAEARPIVEERDRVAAEAFASGDDGYARSYRQAPQIIIRKRPRADQIAVDTHGYSIDLGSSDSDSVDDDLDSSVSPVVE